MASGHVNRANRPNTWLLRPACNVKILLANPEPSTHGPKRTSRTAHCCLISTTGKTPVRIFGNDCQAPSVKILVFPKSGNHDLTGAVSPE